MNYKCKTEALSIIINKASINYSREKSCVCGISIVAYQDYQDRCRPHKRRNWIFTHEAHAHNNYVQEVEVHGWLLSGSEEDYTLLRLFFDSCSYNERFGARLGHRLKKVCVDR